jgi:hypothetical protein
MGGVSLAQAAPPPMNLGAPPPAIPVQQTPGSWTSPGTQAVNVPQSAIPTITVPAGPVGSVGLPAMNPAPQPLLNIPDKEIIYVLPSGEKNEELCVDGKPGISATAAKIVPAGTPGAVPVAVRTVNVVRPKVDYHWSYSPIHSQTSTLVKVVNPRTGKVVKQYCKEDEKKSSLPWLHRKETVTYETVAVKVAEPVSLNQPASQGIQQPRPSGSAPTAYQSRYQGTIPEQSNTVSTSIIP